MARRRRSISEAFGAGQQEPEREQRQPDQKGRQDATQQDTEVAGGKRYRQYGRRAAQGFSQINANVPTDLKKEVQKRLIDDGRTMQELIEDLLEQYLEGKAG